MKAIKKKAKEVAEAFKRSAEKQLEDDQLERTLATTTNATIYTGAGAIGAEIWGWAAENSGALMLAGAFGRVFNGMLVIDVVLGVYLVAKRLRRKQARKLAKATV